MIKKRFVKFGIVTVGIAIVGMFMFPLHLIEASSAPEETTAVEETSITEDLDNVQEEVEDIDEVGDLDEADEVDKASDTDEADENLPGGDHEDPDGVDVEHEFEGIE